LHFKLNVLLSHQQRQIPSSAEASEVKVVEGGQMLTRLLLDGDGAGLFGPNTITIDFAGGRSS
jgi:hypothetical protein